MTARWATTGAFLVNGAVVGTWVAQIPWIQERFDLSKSAMGFVLIGMSLAVVLIVPVAGHAVARYGSERLTLLGGIACALAVNLVVVMPDPALLVVGLFVLGGTSAVMDVAMNAHGVTVETALRRPIMSSLHAGWAFGGMAGAAFAASVTALGLDPRAGVPIASAVLLAAVVVFCLRLGPGSAAAGDETPAFALPSRGVLLLALLCLLTMVTEGAMGDWAGIYLRQDLGSSAAVAAAAFSFFTAGMTVGRVAGDAINKRIGPVALLRLGAVLTAAPLALMLLTGTPVVALLALFLVGLGVANGVPLMFSAAGRQPGTPAGPGIAAVSSMGSLGFLAGPPFIGFVADASSLAWALSSLVLGAVVVFALAGRAAGRTLPETEPSAPAPEAAAVVTAPR